MKGPRTITLERFLYLFTVCAVLLGLGWLLFALRAVLTPFLVALVLAFLLDPTVDRVRRLVKSQVLAVSITLAVIVAACIGLALFVTPQLTREAARFARLMSEELPRWQEQAQQTPWMRDLLDQVAATDPQRYLTSDNLLAATRRMLPGFWQGVNNVFGWFLGLVGVFTMLIYLVFILIDEEDVKDNWEKLIPRAHREEVVLIIGDLQRVMNLFFRGQLKIALVLMLVYTIGFSAIGLPLAIVLGMIAGVLSIIPYFSLLTVPVALLSAGLLALEQHRSLGPLMALVLVVYAVAYGMDGMLLTPRIQGRNTGLRPQYILLSLSVWGSLMGVAGMIIALPITTVIISYYKRSIDEEGTSSQEPPGPPPSPG